MPKEYDLSERGLRKNYFLNLLSNSIYVLYVQIPFLMAFFNVSILSLNMVLLGLVTLVLLIIFFIFRDRIYQKIGRKVLGKKFTLLQILLALAYVIIMLLLMVKYQYYIEIAWSLFSSSLLDILLYSGSLTIIAILYYFTYFEYRRIEKYLNE